VPLVVLTVVEGVLVRVKAKEVETNKASNRITIFISNDIRNGTSTPINDRLSIRFDDLDLDLDLDVDSIVYYKTVNCYCR
jgi:hypothetical protein